MLWASRAVVLARCCPEVVWELPEAGLFPAQWSTLLRSASLLLSQIRCFVLPFQGWTNRSISMHWSLCISNFYLTQDPIGDQRNAYFSIFFTFLFLIHFFFLFILPDTRFLQYFSHEFGERSTNHKRLVVNTEVLVAVKWFVTAHFDSI